MLEAHLLTVVIPTVAGIIIGTARFAGITTIATITGIDRLAGTTTTIIGAIIITTFLTAETAAPVGWSLCNARFTVTTGATAGTVAAASLTLKGSLVTNRTPFRGTSVGHFRFGDLALLGILESLGRSTG